MIVVDASVLVAHLDEADAHHERASTLLLQAVASPVGASPITLVEALVGPAASNRLEEARAALRQLAVDEVALGADAPARLARLRAEVGVKLPDCCVLLAAQDVAADAILTFDARLASAAERLGIPVR